MTVLSRIPADAASPSYITVQCDVCVAPWVASNSPAALRANDWMLTLDGKPLDVCPPCKRRKFSGELVQRSRTPELGAGRLPNLVVIGAEKCATNSLHNYLDTHPEISMSDVKEPNFFQDPDHLNRLGQYAGSFDRQTKIVGESSTAYSKYPAVPGVPSRMAALVPDVRLIYIVRDPVERSLSAFVEARSHGNESRDATNAFADLDDDVNTYIATSKYALQLSRYLADFSREQLLVLDMDALSSRPEETMVSVYEFLDVDPRVAGTDFNARLNTRRDKREYRPVARSLRNQSLLKFAYRLPPRQRERLLRPLRRLLSSPAHEPDLPSDLRERIACALADDAADFRELARQPFDAWSI